MAAVAGGEVCTIHRRKELKVKQADSTHLVTVADNTQADTVNLKLNDGEAERFVLPVRLTSQRRMLRWLRSASFDALSDFEQDGFVVTLQVNTAVSDDDVLHIYRNDGEVYYSADDTTVSFNTTAATADQDEDSTAATFQTDNLTEDVLGGSDNQLDHDGCHKYKRRGGDRRRRLDISAATYLARNTLRISSPILCQSLAMTTTVEKSLNGLVNQMTQAINDAGITGVKATADTANTRVSLIILVEVTNARATKDHTVDANIKVDTSDGWNDEDVSITLEVQLKMVRILELEITGTLIMMKIGADISANSVAGVITVKVMIDAENLEGIIVYENEDAVVMGVFVQQSLGEFTNSNHSCNECSELIRQLLHSKRKTV